MERVVWAKPRIFTGYARLALATRNLRAVNLPEPTTAARKWIK
jgi:hypothetical protein